MLEEQAFSHLERRSEPAEPDENLLDAPVVAEQPATIPVTEETKKEEEPKQAEKEEVAANPEESKETSKVEEVTAET